MSRKPWQVFEATGLAGLQIPHEDVPTILEAARRFDATHLLLRGKGERSSLGQIYLNPGSDSRFEFVARDRRERLYRLHLD